VRRQNTALDLEREPLFLRFEPRDFLSGHLRNLGIACLGLKQHAIVLKVGDCFQIP